MAPAGRPRARTARLCAVAAVAALLTSGFTGLTAGALTAHADTPTGLVIDAETVLRPVSHVGSGGLYALATESTPALAPLLPLHLNQLTQPPPGVQQLGNGATVPTGDALVVSGTATAAGAQQTVRMPDIYPNFPYGWVSWSDWLSKVDTMVKARLAATSTTNINGWELWNEPNWTWNTAAAGPFNDGWTRTYKEVRSLDSVTPIVGPSIDRWDPDYMRSFLTAAKAANTLPDVVSWHELAQGWADIPEHVSEYRTMEASLGIAPRPISINEYAWTNEVDVPSSALHYLAQFERSGVRDAERAYWFESGTVNGLLHDNQPTGTYWLYDWYGGQTGNMVAVTPAGSQDGVAAVDTTRKIVDAVVGGAAGDNTVTVSNVGSFGSTVRVSLDYTPTSGRMTNVSAPTHLWTRTLPVANGSVVVPIAGEDADGAYHVVVTPSDGPTTTYQQRYEAENATVVNASRASDSAASNGGYVTGLDNTGDARSDSFVDFAVNAPVTGDYDLGMRYANGGTSPATQGLRVDGGTWQTVSLPATGSATTFVDQPLPTVHLTQGYHVIRLAKGSPGFAGGSGSANLDDITVVSQTPVPAPPTPPDAPVATFVDRVEAENGTVVGGTIYPSPKASAGEFVGGLDSPTSSVTSTVTVPVDGTYTLAIGYANGGGFTQNGSTDAVLSMSVDGAPATDERFPLTGAWGVPGGSFPAKTLTVALTAGSHTIALGHEANQNYAELDYLQVSSPAGAFVDGRTTQTITFPAVGQTQVGAPDVPLAATASSGLPVSYSATGDCSIVNGAVHAVTAGSCTITADQGGNNQYDPAPSSSQTINVTATASTATVGLTSSTPANAVGWYRSPVTVAVNAPQGSGLTVQYSLDFGAWKNVGKPFTVTRNAYHALQTRLLDSSRQPIESSLTQQAFGIDAAAPQVSIVAVNGLKGSPRNPVTLQWHAYDGLSGVAAMTVAVDGGAPVPATEGGSTQLSAVGSHPVVLTVTDVAGNVKVATASVTITADPATAVTAASTVTRGQYATINLSGFVRYETVTVTIGGTAFGQIVTDRNGRATLTAVVPTTTPPDRQDVLATGGVSGLTATRPIQVL